jgi:exopolyphosphatase / guanosine-5'-triphosphate,3'-diphosphate pyrophosphatase
MSEGLPEVVAVIDIGSNSGRVAVFKREPSKHLRLLAGSRAALRLVHDVDTRGELSDKTMARATEAIRDFKAVATGAGAKQIVAVATAAMRDAANGVLFVERLRRELGVRVEIIGGMMEARYGFAGAVRGLPVARGLLFDVGGGSMQITQFSRRRLRNGVSLPFGALRLSERFLESDPPSPKQLRRLRDHVHDHLPKARVPRLAAGDYLVGTGGTLRNLARIDHHTRHYPVSGLHGYELSVGRLGDIIDQLAAMKEKRRDEIAGLSTGRADSIVGGAVAIHTLAEYVHAKHILVSGHGVREGVALGLLNLPIGSPKTVRDASLSSLVCRFDGWREDASSRRRALASSLQRALVPRTPASVVAALDHAARVLDIGRSLGVVDRHQHVADILLSTDLTGFAHSELALAAAIVRRAGNRHSEIPSLALAGDTLADEWLERAAIMLTLADEIEARCPRGGRIALTCEVERDVRLTVPQLTSWLVKDVDKRFERAFARPLIIRR